MDAEQLALATGAAAYRWEDLTKAPVSPSMLVGHGAVVESNGKEVF